MRSISSNLAGPSSSATPRARRSTMFSGTCSWPSGARTRQTYSRSTSNDGCISALASSPSVLSSSRPVVLMSRRPIAIQRAPLSAGRASKMVGRPSGSSRVVTSPSGLLYISTRAGSVSALATNWRPSSSILSPLLTLMPTCAVSPLTLTRPSAMRCSSARREPRPAWARTLCRRSSRRGASAVVSAPRFRVSLRLFCSVMFLLLRLGQLGLVCVLLGNGRRLDGVGVLLGIVHVRRALARRGFGGALKGMFVGVFDGRVCASVLRRRALVLQVVGGSIVLAVVGRGDAGLRLGQARVVIGVDIVARIVGVGSFHGSGGDATCRDRGAFELQLRLQFADVLELRQWRQLVQALEAEVVEEALGRAEQRRLAGYVAVADDADPLALFQRLDDVAVDRDAADLLDLAARDRLAVGDQGQGFQCGAGVAGLPLGPQARDPGVHVGLDLEAEARGHFDEFDAAFGVGLAQGFQRL